MKINRRLKQNEHAVSAVIGVTLMVAVTIAMGAVAYAYFTGMIGGQKAAAPVIEFLPSESENTITVSSADPNINWADINITFTNSVGVAYLEKTGIVTAGNLINLDTEQALTGDVSITFVHVPSNTQVGYYSFKDVQ